MGIQYLNVKELPPQSVYLSSGDSLAQRILNIKKERVSEEIKFLSILQNKIIIPSSFILRSYETFKALQDHSTLLQEGIIVPTIHFEHSVFNDWAENYRKINSLSLDHTTNVINFIEENAKIIGKYDPIDMAKVGYPSFRKNIKDFCKTYYTSILEKIQPVSEFNRNKILDRLSSLPVRRKNLITQLLLVNYQLNTQLHIGVHSQNVGGIQLMLPPIR